MLTATSQTTIGERASQITSLTLESSAPLARRLGAEVDAAEKRVQALQAEATRVFLGREERIKRFVVEADRIDAILQQRLETFLKVSVFQDIKQTMSVERAPEGSGFHARTATLTIPYCDKRPVPMVLSFRVGHDDSIENVVLDFRMEVRPILVKFDDHDQLVFPLDQAGEDAIAAWIDDKLVGFTRTYFEVFFNDEYQKKSLARDPVMNVRFPRAFALAKKEFQKETYYFYTEESFARFEKDPSEFIKTV